MRRLRRGGLTQSKRVGSVVVGELVAHTGFECGVLSRCKERRISSLRVSRWFACHQNVPNFNRLPDLQQARTDLGATANTTFATPRSSYSKVFASDERHALRVFRVLCCAAIDFGPISPLHHVYRSGNNACVSHQKR